MKTEKRDQTTEEYPRLMVIEDGALVPLELKTVEENELCREVSEIKASLLALTSCDDCRAASAVMNELLARIRGDVDTTLTVMELIRHVKKMGEPDPDDVEGTGMYVLETMAGAMVELGRAMLAVRCPLGLDECPSDIRVSG